MPRPASAPRRPRLARRGRCGAAASPRVLLVLLASLLAGASAPLPGVATARAGAPPPLAPGATAPGEAAPGGAVPEEPPVAGVLEALADDPQPRVGAVALARVLGASLTAEGDVLVLRRGGRALTLFAGSSEALLAGDEATPTSLSAPAERRGEAWWLPLDAGAPLGLVRVDEERVRGPDGRSWRLSVAPPRVTPASPRAEVTWAAPGARAVQLFAPGPAGRTDALALWVADLSLAALVVPEARAELDAAITRSGDHDALLLVATSLVPGASVRGPAVRSEARTWVASGERLEVLAGDAAAVGPERPWIAVVWLPAGTRLDRPLTVAWHGAEADVVFRE